eukprot:TRINITY_DN4299_c0_g1_i4.p1 TRINITY_DN4299_c0_g1~~TRINITY_DN4299_c0_g1_i4.p1  ORF type:complete len:907 (+),score=178.65 TRINITY_DN4299_c0_g1_i4:71-2791(+)
MEVCQAWIRVTEVAHRIAETPRDGFGARALRGELCVLRQAGLTKVTVEWVLGKLKEGFRLHIVPQFWKHFADLSDNRASLAPSTFELWAYQQFQAAVRFLHSAFLGYLAVVEELDDTLQLGYAGGGFASDLQALVFHQQPLSSVFDEALRLFCAGCFAAFARGHPVDDLSTAPDTPANGRLSHTCGGTAPRHSRQPHPLDPDSMDEDGTPTSQRGVVRVGPLSSSIGRPRRTSPRELYGRTGSGVDDDSPSTMLMRSPNASPAGSVTPTLVSSVPPSPEFGFGSAPSASGSSTGGGGGHGSTRDFADVCAMLQQLEMLDQCMESGMAVVYQCVSSTICGACRGQFDRPLLGCVLGWLEVVVFPFLEVFTGAATNCTPAENPQYQQWRTRAEYFVYHTFASLRLSEFFDLVVDFPESRPTLGDLKQCLLMTAQHQQLVSEAKRQIERRLLHAGAKTSDILRFLINAINALNVLYTHGGMLEQVTEDTKAYLRQRSDAVRCVVLGLINDSASDLADLLHTELKQSNEDNTLTVYYSSDEEENVVNEIRGKPSPLRSATDPKHIVDMARAFGLTRKIDIIKLLVGIFGSKDVFINEYRTILGDRLLAASGYDTTLEDMTTELLKIRCGETALQSCEVMLRDIADSKRVNANIRQRLAEQFALRHPEVAGGSADGSVNVPQVECTIVSRLCWPQFNETETYRPHPSVLAMQEDFTKQYCALKAPRTLQWLQPLGMVSLELEIGGSCVRCSVSPVQATLILHFADRSQWSATDLSTAMEVPQHVLQKKITFWVSKAVLLAQDASSDAALYTVNESGTGVTMDEVITDDSERPLAFAELNEQDWSVVGPFVRGILTNFTQLSLQAIHNHLKLLITDPPFTRSERELKEFLTEWIHEGLLTLESGLYKLVDKL